VVTGTPNRARADDTDTADDPAGTLPTVPPGGEVDPADSQAMDNGEEAPPVDAGDGGEHGRTARDHAHRIERHERPTTGPGEHAATRDDPDPGSPPG
jgi:hypothetical protein